MPLRSNVLDFYCVTIFFEPLFFLLWRRKETLKQATLYYIEREDMYNGLYLREKKDLLLRFDAQYAPKILIKILNVLDSKH